MMRSALKTAPDGRPSIARHRADMRTAGTLETMPHSLLAEVEDAVAAYAEAEESGQP